MKEQEKFYFHVSTEMPPFNRRIYESAKWLFTRPAEFLVWVSMPWLQASPFAFFASLLVNLMAAGGPTPVIWEKFFTNIMDVGLIWTAILGVIVLIGHVLSAIFE